ncbi:MAG: SigE family RNA polymerase sigma factor [Propionibacteriaceae bacterium]|nr:SigE family RNA polymerase sigma factor [Propionibacteriaceae bacterium]
MSVDNRIGVAVGAEPSFDDYVRARSDGLLRLAWLITRNWEDARDAVQDALASLYPRWDRLPEGDRRGAYISRTVVNACLVVIRRRRSQPVPDPSVLAEAPVSADPSTAVAEADAAWRLCAELPPAQRAAVVLRFYNDYSFGQIAEALGCPESTARSHVHRAMATLRSRLQKGENDE